MTDKLTKERRSENMRRIRAKHTSPEMAVRHMVQAMGYRYRLHVQTLPGKPDLVFPRLSKIIEVRGCFWHQHTGCIDSHIPKTRLDYWGPKLEKNAARDRKNMKQLRACGWDVLVLWECEMQNMNRVKRKLAVFLRHP